VRRLPAAPCPPPPPSHHDRGSCQARGAAPHAAPSSCGPQRSAAARVASTSARRPALTRAWVVARRRCCSSCQSAASPVRARLDRLAAMDAPRRASWSRALWMPSSARVPCVAVLLFGCVWGRGGGAGIAWVQCAAVWAEQMATRGRAQLPVEPLQVLNNIPQHSLLVLKQGGEVLAAIWGAVPGAPGAGREGGGGGAGKRAGWAPKPTKMAR